MLTSNGYNLVYDKKRNQIVIGLPQTWRTITNTVEPVLDRRIDVEEKDLTILLTTTQAIFLNETNSHEEEEKMSDMMMFPKTVDEFMEKYKIVDSEEVYTNGAELIPIFRMKQWFDHIGTEPVKHGHWEYHPTYIGASWGFYECSECGNKTWTIKHNYCPNCGAKMEEDEKL